MPLHRLDEVPRVRGTIADITCDSDGEDAGASPERTPTSSPSTTSGRMRTIS